MCGPFVHTNKIHCLRTTHVLTLNEPTNFKTAGELPDRHTVLQTDVLREQA